jgi:hypothetical protein
MYKVEFRTQSACQNEYDCSCKLKLWPFYITKNTKPVSMPQFNDNLNTLQVSVNYAYSHRLTGITFNKRLAIDKICLSNSMEQSPSEANTRSASQEISRLLRNSKVHCRVHTDPPLPRPCVTFHN